jgi:hypothetical protein
MNHSTPDIEQILKDYLLYKEKSIVFGKKRLDAEKEYNREPTQYNGEAKHYSLEQANKIYKAYHEMIANGEESAQAQSHLNEMEEKLREIGQILFEATITAEITMGATNGEIPAKRSVRVTYNNGQPVVS